MIRRLARWALQCVCGGVTAGVVAGYGAQRWTDRRNRRELTALRTAQAVDRFDVWGTD